MNTYIFNTIMIDKFGLRHNMVSLKKFLRTNTSKPLIILLHFNNWEKKNQSQQSHNKRR